MAKLLYTVRERPELTAADWQRFRDKAAQDGHSPSQALARLIRQYIDRGFDDRNAGRATPAS